MNFVRAGVTLHCVKSLRADCTFKDQLFIIDNINQISSATFNHINHRFSISIILRGRMCKIKNNLFDKNISENDRSSRIKIHTTYV